MEKKMYCNSLWKVLPEKSLRRNNRLVGQLFHALGCATIGTGFSLLVPARYVSDPDVIFDHWTTYCVKHISPNWTVTNTLSRPFP